MAKIDEEYMYIVDAIVKSYIDICGQEKWNSFTAEEQHDLIMTCVHDMNVFIDIVKEKMEKGEI